MIPYGPAFRPTCDVNKVGPTLTVSRLVTEPLSCLVFHGNSNVSWLRCDVPDCLKEILNMQRRQNEKMLSDKYT